ncbi:hypothetical protein L2E82_49385 [Cichorium intybus]|uniref:Uncharacterized protein n=1 Tax=Cichorium intybus TaxID=13427 RepID=A0ACB8Z1C5_CICIN|nr:hypothetical protein L2E82_49385 [Cichorium intybus]
MGLIDNSPVNSSSSHNFAAFLDAMLDSVSDTSSQPEEEEEEEHHKYLTERTKRRKISISEITKIPNSASHTEQEIVLESVIDDICTHPGFIGGMCFKCGEKMDNDNQSGVAFGYIHKDLRLTTDEIDRLRERDLKNVLRHKKLYLRFYALEMANLVDPGRVYFDSRVIAQGDCTQRHKKRLDVVLGRETAILILDDSESVWEHKENLILMERYHFFASSCRQFHSRSKSLSELRRDESDVDGALAIVLKVLKRVHSMFFDPEPGDNFTGRDVRQMLRVVRGEVLKGCKIVLSRVCPTKYHDLWMMAERLGATCSTEVDSSVTHVISTDIGTRESCWAVQENKFLVEPRWLEAANFRWKRQPEEKFLVKGKH